MQNSIINTGAARRFLIMERVKPFFFQFIFQSFYVVFEPSGQILPLPANRANRIVLSTFSPVVPVQGQKIATDPIPIQLP